MILRPQLSHSDDILLYLENIFLTKISSHNLENHSRFQKILNSSHDIFLGFLAGFMQLGFGFILITIGAQRTPSAMVGIIMLTEAVLGPLWAWMFINEQPPFIVIIGGAIVIFAVLLQFYNLYSLEKKTA